MTDRLQLALMLTRTFTIGVNDAVGYLGLDKVFTGNTTGNAATSNCLRQRSLSSRSNWGSGADTRI